MAFRFEQLEIWKYANTYASHIYQITKLFPRDELFGLTNQLRRAANSVPANIAEGSGSVSKKDFSHYLDIAIKSTYETVSHLFLAQQENYITFKQKEDLYNEAEMLCKKIQSFKKWLQNK